MGEVRGFVSVVVPLFNAQAFVEDFTRECLDVLRANYRDFELILVDDASGDETVARVDRLLQANRALRLIRLARRFGPDVALRAGMDSAIGDFIVLMYPECDPPADIPRLVQATQGGYGVVTGTDPSRCGEGLVKRVLRSLFYKHCERFLGISYPRCATRFQALTRPAATAVLRVRDKRAQFPVLASQVGYGSATVPYRQVRRPTARGYKRPVNLLDRALSIMVLNSISPLRIVSYVGIGAGCLNLLYALYVVAVNLLLAQVAPGWTTLSLQVTSMFFFVFLILVVVCEYVGRILEETKDRPLYHVLEERNGSALLDLNDSRNVLDRSA